MRLLNSLLVIIRIRSRSQIDCLEQRKNNPGHRVSIGFSLFFLFPFLLSISGFLPFLFSSRLFL